MSGKKKKDGKRNLKGRNRAVFFALLAFAFLVYAITIVKIKLGYH